ncbi:MAG: aminotransferase class I/II-fold pyridoxal phosphate-dependent enzyme [Planctomycetota bacterium]|nr:aminotransferase class I/II-fold pyridoxal phosphate-dependent enzyme [Planctomycetota bacterium]
MALYLSKKSDCVMQSEIRAMSIECDKVGGINLSQGVCDTEVPAAVRRAAQSAIDEGFNTYTRYDGLAELREALARKLAGGGMKADPNGEITVSAGATGAFYCACLALLDPGDEAILFEPYYGYHLQTLLAVGAVPTYVRMTPPQWTFSMDALERACTPKTRGIMINTPANPSGKVFTEAELKALAEFAERHDLFVFTDEIYEYFLYDGRRHIPPATIPGLRERTITISGLSKTFSITGWRIGYAVSSPRWAQTIGFFNDLVYVCAPAPLQIGVARGLDCLPQEYYSGLCAEYSHKRDKICTALERAGLAPHVPQGAYYVLADISRIPGSNSKERAMRLLQDTGVACVPGEAFFDNAHDGDNLARFCFAKSGPDLDEACRRLEKLHY